jgi:hypothetical protein
MLSFVPGVLFRNKLVPNYHNNLKNWYKSTTVFVVNNTFITFGLFFKKYRDHWKYKSFHDKKSSHNRQKIKRIINLMYSYMEKLLWIDWYKIYTFHYMTHLNVQIVFKIALNTVYKVLRAPCCLLMLLFHYLRQFKPFNSHHVASLECFSSFIGSLCLTDFHSTHSIRNNTL